MTARSEPSARADPAALAALAARSRRDVEEGLLPTCQVAVGLNGELVLDETFGAPAGSRYVTFSVTKALTAALAWLAIGDGLVSAQTPVAEVIPSFAANGKQAVTLAHLLTHTAGFPRAPMRPEEGADPQRRIERMASWRLDWAPGSQTQYHATSASWVVAAVVEQVTGRSPHALLAERVCTPLAIPALELGTDGAVLDLTLVGDPDQAAERLGARVAETGESHLLRFNEPSVRAVGVPGAGGVGSAADVALFYQALLHNSGGIWDAEVLSDATRNVRNILVDPLFNVVANRTLGLVVAGDDDKAVVRGFGRTVGPRAFGAPGVGGQVAWADPDTGLSFCYLTNGLDVDAVGSFTRSAKIAGLAGRCTS